ncbi:MAG: T9SS type A sorting domain-containing protein [bacterium]
MKFSVLLILFFAILCFIAPSKAQNIRVIQADTIFKGYDSGVTSSLKIVNHGTSIIYNHDGKLYEINAITYEPIREIILDDSLTVTKFDIDENCKYIIYNTKVDTLTFVADYNTGTTVKVLHGIFYLTKDYLFLHLKDLRTTYYTNFNFAKYDISNLSLVNNISVKYDCLYNHTLSLGMIKTVYYKNELILQTVARGSGSSEGHYVIKLYTVDFDSTKFNEIFKNLTQDYSNLYMSENGIFNVFYLKGYNEYPPYNYVDTYLSIFNSNYKNIDGIKESSLIGMFNIDKESTYNDIIIINDRFLFFSVSQKDGKNVYKRILVYDLIEKKFIKIIDFSNYTSARYQDKFILSNKTGCLATLTFDQLPVLDNKNIAVGFNVSYSNNNLILQSNKSEGVDISIMNITGEVVETQYCVYLNEGSNTFQLNNQLANGLYFCIIKTPESISSHKFMVIK